MRGRGGGEEGTDRIVAAIRAALYLVLPSRKYALIDRLNETGGTIQGEPLTRAQPNLAAAAGTFSTVVDYLHPNRDPSAVILEWWHDLELGEGATGAAYEAAWASTDTQLLLNGTPLTISSELRGQRCAPNRPARILQELKGGDRFAIAMRVQSAWAGGPVLANAAFRGHLA